MCPNGKCLISISLSLCCVPGTVLQLLFYCIYLLFYPLSFQKWWIKVLLYNHSSIIHCHHHHCRRSRCGNWTSQIQAFVHVIVYSTCPLCTWSGTPDCPDSSVISRTVIQFTSELLLSISFTILNLFDGDRLQISSIWLNCGVDLSRHVRVSALV